MRKIYVNKNNPLLFQEYPIPTFVDDFYTVEVDDTFDASGLTYDPVNNTFINYYKQIDRDYYKLEIDRLISIYRKKYSSDIMWQPIIYIRKEEEAKEYQSTGVIGKLLQTEIDATSTDADTAATRILMAATQFYDMAAKTETIRREAKAKVDISTSLTQQDVDKILSEVSVKLESL